jgi:hypothetical protein
MDAHGAQCETEMISYQEAREHAHKCGFVLDGIDAVPLHRVISRSKSGKGAWPAIDIVHPETLAVVCPAGFWIDDAEVKMLESLGIDYVILEN